MGSKYWVGGGGGGWTQHRGECLQEGMCPWEASRPSHEAEANARSNCLIWSSFMVIPNLAKVIILTQIIRGAEPHLKILGEGGAPAPPAPPFLHHCGSFNAR